MKWLKNYIFTLLEDFNPRRSYFTTCFNSSHYRLLHLIEAAAFLLYEKVYFTFIPLILHFYFTSLYRSKSTWRVAWPWWFRNKSPPFYQQSKESHIPPFEFAKEKMSSFAGAVASSSPHSLFHLLPTFSSAARTTCSSSFSLRAPKSSSPFFNSGICVSLRSKSTTPRISIWVASKRVPLQTHESNWEYPYDGSDSDYDDDDEGNKEEREQEFENDFEKDEEEKRIEAGVAAAKYVNTATAPTQYEEELIKGIGFCRLSRQLIELSPFIFVFCD